MLAVTSHGPEDIRVIEVEKPKLEASTDAIVRVTTAALCGTDMHIYHGKVPNVPAGWIVGHEFCGVVEDVGDAITEFKAGDRVVSSMYVACGRSNAVAVIDTVENRKTGEIPVGQLPWGVVIR